MPIYAFVNPQDGPFTIADVAERTPVYAAGPKRVSRYSRGRYPILGTCVDVVGEHVHVATEALSVSVTPSDIPRPK